MFKAFAVIILGLALSPSVFSDSLPFRQLRLLGHVKLSNTTPVSEVFTTGYSSGVEGGLLVPKQIWVFLRTELPKKNGCTPTVRIEFGSEMKVTNMDEITKPANKSKNIQPIYGPPKGRVGMVNVTYGAMARVAGPVSQLRLVKSCGYDLEYTVIEQIDSRYFSSTRNHLDLHVKMGELTVSSDAPQSQILWVPANAGGLVYSGTVIVESEAPPLEGRKCIPQVALLSWMGTVDGREQFGLMGLKNFYHGGQMMAMSGGMQLRLIDDCGIKGPYKYSLSVIGPTR